VSREQREALDALVRKAPLDLGGELAEQREVMEQMMASIPLADDVTTSDATVGGIEAILVETSGTRSDRLVLYLHGGAYALGSARAGVGLAAEVARRAQARTYSLDYRLAPEYPYPAGVDDCVAAYRGLLDGGVDAARIAIVGESAGAGLVAATLVRSKADRLPQPACAALMSPWVDLTLTSPTLDSKADVDPALTVQGLRRRAGEYVAPADAQDASPLFADLSGLAPMLVQVGSHEILLGDALGLARRVAECDGRVGLEVWPDVPHVFQGFASMLDEGAEALDALGAFVARWLSAVDAVTIA
jgi:monoterpene epsilon-lactone hydrolase